MRTFRGLPTTSTTRLTAQVNHFLHTNLAAAHQAASSSTRSKMQMLEKLNGLDLKSFPLEFDESPSSDISTLPLLTTPLPPAEDMTWIQHHTPDWNAEQEGLHPPAAPVMKDLDSFTEGTGKGSFDSLLDEAASYEGDLLHHPDDYSLHALGFPDLDPSMSDSIEQWREEVSGYGLAAPSLGVTDLPEDLMEREAMEEAESMLDIFNLGSEELDDTVNDMSSYDASISSAPLTTATTPRVMKRARSRSPTSQCSRRIRRARSKSLSSICELTNVPPWRAKNIRGSFLNPFD
ncbi:hypothetical protein FPV67DRAFT_1105599 [Lyophyllum atratum]|nr:hypothetical protein FPV67DRAFT_1105599 [Lyophyllum atratum]